MPTVYSIPLRDIQISDFNVRSDTDRNREDILELAKSIHKHGQLQPVVIRGEYGHPPYELIIGSRRFLAHQLLKKTEILATFFGTIDDTQAKILSLTENLQRVVLNHADAAKAVTALYIQYKRDDHKVAKELGLSLSTVRGYIKVEEQATDKAKQLLKEKRVSLTDVKRVIDASGGDKLKANRLLTKMTSLTKYEKSRLVNYGKEHPNANADKMIEEAKKPKLEYTIILNLSKEIIEALAQAEEKLAMEKEAIATNAITQWLKDNNFIK